MCITHKSHLLVRLGALTVAAGRAGRERVSSRKTNRKGDAVMRGKHEIIERLPTFPENANDSAPVSGQIWIPRHSVGNTMFGSSAHTGPRIAETGRTPVGTGAQPQCYPRPEVGRWPKPPYRTAYALVCGTYHGCRRHARGQRSGQRARHAGLGRTC